MLVDPGSPDDMVDRIYEAAVMPEHWSSFLVRFATFAECREAIVLTANGDNLKFVGSSRVAETLAEEHYKYVGGGERTRRLLERNRAGFVTDFDVFSPEELQSIDLFADYLRPRGFGRGVATAVSLPEGEIAVLHAEGNHEDGPFSTDMIERLDLLRPHFARSVSLSARLSFERVRTAIDVLTGLGYPACAVRPNGQVLLANAEFDAARSFWTTRLGDKIALVDRRADGQLTESLRSLPLNVGIGSIAIPATGELGPAVLQVVPLRRSALDLFTQSLAILVLMRPKPAPVDQVGLIKVLFDLSAAEADVATRIASGQSLSEIAGSAQKSVETVRNQLKTIFRKTGCNRQADLTRLLMSLTV